MIRIRLENREESEVHRTFRGSTVVVGRSKKCDLSLPKAKGLSRFHCRLVLKDGRCQLEDLGSRNGTLLNGRPVSEAEVQEGDVIEAATATFRVESIRDEEPTEELVHPCLHCGHLFSAGRDACPRCGTEIRRRGKTRSIGTLTFPGYRLIRRIGSGGMGIVFEAQDLERDQVVALKVLRPHLARDTTYLVRFVEEIRMLTSLRHDSIVQVYGRGRQEDLHYITMELVDGPSARDSMRGKGRLKWEEAVRIAWGAAKGLNAAYQQAGVVHGDVKPGNFLLTKGGRVKLCDFGLAGVDLIRHPSRNRAAEEERRGTAAYASPERFSQGRPTVHSDMYSLGVSLFQMAVGELPFRGGSVAAFREAHRTQPVPEMADLIPDVNPALQLLLERMMAKKPDDRHPDYPSVIADISLLM